MSAVIEPPWYRQFWPWFILALLGSVVIASLITLSIALKDPDGVVIGSVTGGGKKVMTAATAELGPVTVTVDPIAGLLLIKLENSPDTDQLQLTLLHPTRVARDIQLELSRISNKEWMAELPSLTAAKPQSWQWLLSADEGQRQAQGRLVNQPVMDQ